MSRNWKSSYRLALLLATAVLLASNVRLLTGDAVPRWDAGSFFAPAQMLVGDAARSGQWLLWNPWIAGGSPTAAEPQVGAFSRRGLATVALPRRLPLAPRAQLGNPGRRRVADGPSLPSLTDES